MRERIEEIRSALEVMASAMIEHKEQLVVTVERHGPEVHFLVQAAQPDLRRLIGTDGINYHALSTLTWSMGNQTQPRIMTRLLRFKPVEVQVDEADPADLLESILLAMGISSLQQVTASQLRGVLERAANQADELRAYLLGMRGDDLQPEVKRALEMGRG